MLTLALDTATRVCTVGLVQDGHVLAEYDISVGLTHSEGLMPQLDQMFVRTGIKKENTDRIAVSIGPGSFTGLRIGLAAAEAMAYAWQCGICGVNTLEAMAYNIPVEGVVLVPVLDAQKGNFYAAFYEWTDGELRKVRPVEMADRETLLQQLQAAGAGTAAKSVVCGTGSGRHGTADGGRRIYAATVLHPEIGSGRAVGEKASAGIM